MISKRLIWLMAITLISFMSAQATIRPVPGQYARIQHAVDDANEGDTVLIAPGVYTGRGNIGVQIKNKGLTIMGDGDASSVIIDGLGWDDSRVFHIENSTSRVYLVNLTLFRTEALWWDSDSSYFSFSGGGIRVYNSQLTVKNCRFLRSYAGAHGGAIYGRNSSVEINSCSFDSCGSLYMGAAIGLFDCNSVTVINSSFFGGYTIDAAGAILSNHSDLEIRNCDFKNNFASQGGYGMGGAGGAVLAENGTLHIIGSRFIDNSTWGIGGAIGCREGDLEVVSSLFTGNHTKAAAIGCYGSAIWQDRGSCAISSCSFIGNYSNCGQSVIEITLATATIHQSIIAESDTCSAFAGSAGFTCTNIFGNALGDWTGSIASQLGQNGNISDDPLFCSAIPGDYRTSTNSPCAAANNDCGLNMGSEAVGCDVVCGDADFSGNVTVSDAIYLITYIFANGEPPTFIETADVDCNSLTNISDVVYLISYIFSGGLSPCSACP